MYNVPLDCLPSSYESGILEDPNQEAPSDLYQMTKDPANIQAQADRIEIEFKQGIQLRSL